MTEKGGEVNEKDMSLGLFYWILVPRLGGSGRELEEVKHHKNGEFFQSLNGWRSAMEGFKTLLLDIQYLKLLWIGYRTKHSDAYELTRIHNATGNDLYALVASCNKKKQRKSTF
jgi:hypothetical protein